MPSTLQGTPPLLSPSIHPQALPGASGCQALLGDTRDPRKDQTWVLPLGCFQEGLGGVSVDRRGQTHVVRTITEAAWCWGSLEKIPNRAGIREVFLEMS